MQIIFRGMMAVILALALPSFAATPSEFYLAMLQKGIAAHDAGRFDAAASPLRIAAFGFVDSIQHYELAQIYLTLTYDRLGEVELARRAARSTVTAERIEARYASLQLPAATRSAFETVARRLLTPSDFATFEQRRTTTAPPAAVQAPPPVQTTPPVQTQPAQTKPATPTTQPQTSTTKPATTQPQTSNSTPAQTAPKTTTTTTTPAPQTAPPPKTTTTTKPATTEPKAPPVEVKPAPPKPAPTQTTTPAKPAINVSARFAAAEQALTGARLAEARTIYRDLLDHATLQRDELLRLAEGFYRARDFAHALRAFEKLGTLRRGEEPYRYYIAVALYESGQYTRAKQELTAVLPFIEITPDVARYRTKIEGAVN